MLNELRHIPEDEAGEKAYDQNGRLTMTKVRVDDSQIITVRYEYSDDSTQNPSRAQNFDAQGKLYSVRNFEYDEAGNRTGVVETTGDGQPIYREHKTLDTNGQVTARDIVYGDSPKHTYYKVTRNPDGNTIEEEVDAL